MFRYILFLTAASAALAQPLRLPVGGSETLRIERLTRVSVADSKIVRARAVPPGTLILAGLKPGQTTVRAFDEANAEHVYEITVMPRSLYSAGQGVEPYVVKIALEFLELDLAVSRSTGLRWPEAIGASAVAGGQSATSGLNYSATFTSAKMLVQFLVKEGWAKILARPDLYVRLGEEATFHSGGELPIAAATENYGRYRRSIEWKRFGLTVKVRPQSGDGFHIASDINVEISEVNPGAQIEGIPALVNRTLQTKMNSVDGETVVLSGLVRQAASQNREGLPLLSRIPLLGSLFSATNQSRDETEVFMAVTFSLVNRSRELERLDGAREKIRAAEESE